jgi:cytochrome o ubiquinol oxidase subunit 2
MRFRFYGMSAADFDAWIRKAKASGRELSRTEYLQLERPSEREPVRRYGAVEAGLFDAIVNGCANPARKCHRDLMMQDKHRASTARDLRTTFALNLRLDALLCTAQHGAAGPLSRITDRD